MRYLALLILLLPLPAFAETNPASTDVERGSSQYWSITDAAQTGLDITSNLTACAWINVEATPTAGQYFTILSKGGISTAINDSTTQFLLIYRNDGDIAIQGFVRGTGVNAFANYTVTLSTATWYHVCMRYVPSTSVSLFVDGSAVGTDDTSSVPASLVNTDRPFGIGDDNQSAAANFFDGLIDDVQIYSNSTVSITDLYNSPCLVSDSATNLQGRWRFDNDGLDSTANNNDLTNNNTATFGSPGYSCGGPSFNPYQFFPF